MSSVLSSAFFLILTLGVLITFHEFGHYWVARRLGVKVLRFSVGFGKPLWRKQYGPDQTEYVVAALPFGGYVKMLDEREGEVAAHELHRAFNRQSVGRRAAIVIAGPAFNLLLAALLYWLVFLIGVPGLRPLVGGIMDGTPAAEAGFVVGDEIVAVGGRQTATWNNAILALLDAGLANGLVSVTVRDEQQQTQHRALSLAQLPGELNQGNVLEILGLRPAKVNLPPLLGHLESGGPAARAGLETGDRVVSVDGQPVEDWGAFVDIIRSKPSTDIELIVERGGEQLKLVAHTAAVKSKKETYGRIGAAVQEQAAYLEKFTVTQKFGPLDAILPAINKTWEDTTLTLKLLYKMVVGAVSVTNLSGPLSIAQYAGGSASIGLVPFLMFLAIVSVSLGVLNLLPVPVLDGGHLMFYAVEAVTGKPIPPNVEVMGQRLGIGLILMMMVVAFYNDIVRLFF